MPDPTWKGTGRQTAKGTGAFFNYRYLNHQGPPLSHTRTHNSDTTQTRTQTQTQARCVKRHSISDMKREAEWARGTRTHSAQSATRCTCRSPGQAFVGKKLATNKPRAAGPPRGFQRTWRSGLDQKEQGGRKEQGGAEPTGKRTGRKEGKGTGELFSL